MANEIKDIFSAAAALTITLDALPSSTTGVGRQSIMIDNATTRYQRIKIWLSIILGTTPVAGAIQAFAIRGDKHATPLRDDNAGSGDAGLTIVNAPCIGALRTIASPTTGNVVRGCFELWTPGPEWGIAVAHDTGVNLGTGCFVHWVGCDPEVQ